MKNKTKNKKGIVDVAITLLMIFILVINLLVSVYLAINMKKISYSFIDNQNVNETFNKTIDLSINTADWLFLIVFALSIIGIILTSFLFYSHPAFMVIWILLALGLIIGSVFISNIYNEISSQQIFNETITYFPTMNYIMDKLPLFTLGIVIISMIIIYAKSQTQPATV